MVYSIESILNKRTRSGRVEYLIKWDGYDEEENTWETRVDLMKDGHQKSIRAYEAERKKKTGSSTSKSRSSSRSEAATSSSPVRSTASSSASRSSKSPKRSTKVADVPTARSSRRSTTKKASPAPVARSSRRSRRGSSASKSPVAKKSTTSRRSATPKRKAVSSSSSEEDEEEEESEEEESDDEDKKEEGEKEETEVSEMLGQTLTVEWLVRVFLLLLLVLSMLASAIIPEIQNSSYLNDSPNMETVLLILEKTTAFPPLLCLLLVLRTKDTRAFASWVAICMVWRTAGEVLMQLPEDNGDVYSLAARAMFGVADFALIVAVCSIVGGEKPVGDILTMTLGVLGVLGVIGSDMILGLLEGTSLFASRFLIMAISLVLVTFSTLLQESI